MTKQKVWFITGSSRGLGRHIVEAALEKGDFVMATARKEEALSDLVRQYGSRIRTFSLDVTNEQEVVTTVKKAAALYGRLDVVVNNAGYGDIAAVEDVTMEDFRAQIDTNFYGAVYVSKAVTPILRQQASGHIIQISSLGGRIASPGLAAYQSAKWALGGFSEALAQEVAPFGVKVTIIEPGGMRTDWAGSSMTIPPISAPYEETVGVFAKMVRKGSGHQPSDPAKIARLIVQLTESDEVPLRLLIGKDAVQYAAASAQQRVKEDNQWRHLSESVAFDTEES
ncbi:short-chain dehydrogenase/reductase [Pullulanibacillus camelliae]|uniref:Short-chain dehydrogenase/reductase n=1 Tax=Pullulanibacillus camelliae TaxID=1707096 RepID=A0A8J2VNB0_9BACL|nr:oxidoreductase [Pullulanibacillus camelliae]GGE35225.1 short-chain dehydrogenase/reductase [Pullulanibacillus camelliae]